MADIQPNGLYKLETKMPALGEKDILEGRELLELTNRGNRFEDGKNVSFLDMTTGEWIKGIVRYLVVFEPRDEASE